MSGDRSQRPPPGHGGRRGPSFFDGFFGGDPFAHMDNMFRSMAMGGDLLGGFAGGSGGAGSFQARQPRSAAREIPIEGPDDEYPSQGQYRLAGPVVDELPDHEHAGHEHLFFSNPDHVEEPEEAEPFHGATFQQPPPYEPKQQAQQTQQAQQAEPPAAPRPAEPSQPQAAPALWQSQQRYNSSDSLGGRQQSAEELLAAMGSLPPGSPHSGLPHRPAHGPAGWAAGDGSAAEAGEAEGPGSPLLVHMNNSTSPFSPQRSAHLLYADQLPPQLPPFGSLGGSGSFGGSGTAGGSMAGGSLPPMAQAQPKPASLMAGAPADPADWLAEAFGEGQQAQHAQQAQQTGHPVSWDEHASVFVATPVSSAQPPAAGQPLDRSPTGPAAARQDDGRSSGGARSAPSPGLLRSPGAASRPGSAAQQQQFDQQLAGGLGGPAPLPRQRRLPAKLREAVEDQLQHAPPARQGTAAGRQLRAAAGRKRRRGSSEDDEGEEAASLLAAEAEDPDWAVPRRPRPPSAGPKRDRRGGGGRNSRGHAA